MWTLRGLTHLPLLVQNHLDGVGGNDDLDLLLLDVLHFELVLCADERRHVDKSSSREETASERFTLR